MNIYIYILLFSHLVTNTHHTPKYIVFGEREGSRAPASHFQYCQQAWLHTQSADGHVELQLVQVPRWMVACSCICLRPVCSKATDSISRRALGFLVTVRSRCF